MSPASVGDDRPDGAPLHTIDFCQFQVGVSGSESMRSDLLGYFKGQFRTRPSMKVDLVRNRLKMIWVHARRYATEMVKRQPFGDLSSRSRVGLAMGEPARSETGSVCENSIPMLIVGTKKDPAGSRESSIFLLPKIRPPLKARRYSRSVALEKSERLTLDPPIASIVFRHESSRLSTPALTQLRRLFQVGLLHRLTLGGGVARWPRSPHLTLVGP